MNLYFSQNFKTIFFYNDNSNDNCIVGFMMRDDKLIGNESKYKTDPQYKSPEYMVNIENMSIKEFFDNEFTSWTNEKRLRNIETIGVMRYLLSPSIFSKYQIVVCDGVVIDITDNNVNGYLQIVESLPKITNNNDVYDFREATTSSLIINPSKFLPAIYID